MARPPQDVTDAELAIMEILWQEESATARRIQELVYPDGTGSHGTIQKLLDRLRAKGFVACDRSVWPYLFNSAVAREELIGRRLRKTAEKLCGGSLQPRLTQLIRETKLSAQERELLHKLLDENDKTS